jgi:hypothetical protein
MRVRCILNDYTKLENSEVVERIKNQFHGHNYSYLSIGEEFIVYGIFFSMNYPWLLILEKDSELPSYLPIDLFEILDERLSKYWRIGSTNMNELGYINHEPNTRLALKEWAEDYAFYENLFESELTAVTLFNKYKKLMDFEYTPSKENQKLYRFIFCGSKPKKSLEEIATLKAVRESKIVHQVKL